MKCVLALLFIVAASMGADAKLTLNKLNTTSAMTFTVADKVYVDGDLVAEGNGMQAAVGCHAHAGANKFKVCGCNVKVVANLRQECKPYGKYTQEVGHCDCGNADCQEVSLSSGYTEKFDW